jgi:hypothetical protein
VGLWNRINYLALPVQEAPMPRFHFEIVDGFKIEDPVGMELPSEEQAKQLAANIARQIAIDVKDIHEFSSTRLPALRSKAGGRPGPAN